MRSLRRGAVFDIRLCINTAAIIKPARGKGLLSAAVRVIASGESRQGAAGANSFHIAIDITSSMVFRRVLRLQRQRGLLRKHFQKSADSVETFRNNEHIARKQTQKSQSE